MGISRLGAESELQLQPTPQPQPHWIQATSMTYTAACSRARTLTHWVRPGMGTSFSQRQHLVLNPLSHSRDSQNISFGGNVSSWVFSGWISSLSLSLSLSHPLSSLPFSLFPFPSSPSVSLSNWEFCVGTTLHYELFFPLPTRHLCATCFLWAQLSPPLLPWILVTHEVVAITPILQMRTVRPREIHGLILDSPAVIELGLKPRPPTPLFFLLHSRWGEGAYSFICF